MSLAPRCFQNSILWNVLPLILIWSMLGCRQFGAIGGGCRTHPEFFFKLFFVHLWICCDFFSCQKIFRNWHFLAAFYKPFLQVFWKSFSCSHPQWPNQLRPAKQKSSAIVKPCTTTCAWQSVKQSGEILRIICIFLSFLPVQGDRKTVIFDYPLHVLHESWFCQENFSPENFNLHLSDNFPCFDNPPMVFDYVGEIIR